MRRNQMSGSAKTGERLARMLCLMVAVGCLGGCGKEPQKAQTQESPSQEIQEGLSQGTQEAAAAQESFYEGDFPEIAAAAVGDVVKFGAYEQDADTANGAEAIEWLVLDRQGEKVLLLSQDILDVKAFHETWKEVTWETCTLRSWLNNSFYSRAFNDTEKLRICQTQLDTPKNPVYGTEGGNATADKVFVLSLDEVKQYFRFGEEKEYYWEYDGDTRLRAGGGKQTYESGLYLFDMETLTEYGKEKGKEYSEAACGRWWLRSTGSTEGTAAYVSFDGAANMLGSVVDRKDNGVRPAIWLDLQP